MRISVDWLRDYVDIPSDISPKQLAYDLTMTTVEVEQAIDLAAPLANVVLAEVASVKPHPNVDWLRVCRMHDGRTVVCGGSNVAAGMKVALALPGAVCLGRDRQPMMIAEAGVRGVSSAGMICTGSELGLADLFPTSGTEITDISHLDTRPGTPLAEAIGYDDVVLDIDNKSLTNRPDLWGHYGIAREIAALYDLELEPLPAFRPPAEDGGFEVCIEDSRRCRRYTATRITGVAATPAPLWMQARLVKVGQRPINLLVDLTNYVMMAIGQPSHAFDARDLPYRVEVRAARSGERLTLLDGTELILDPETLVIASHEEPVALAGVMGGRFAVREDTTEILLEIANFEAVEIRRAARRFGVRTESSTRFEKGLDPDRVDVALGLFQQLLGELAPRSRVVAHGDAFPAPLPQVTVEVPVVSLHRRLGQPLPAAKMRALLARLGFSTEGEDVLMVRVPSWRATGDVRLPEDIVEEIARLYGYEALGFSPPVVALTAPVIQPRYRMERRLKEYLAFRCGLREVVTYPWVESRLLDAAGLSEIPTLGLAHPPLPGARLAPSLVPQLLWVIASNLRYTDAFAVFELNRVFRPGSAPGVEGFPEQPHHLAAAWVGADAGELFYRAKGALEGLARGVQIARLDFGHDCAAPWADPAAWLSIHAGEVTVGHLAVVAPRAKRMAGIRRAEAALFELDVDALQPHPSRENRFEPLPKYPAVESDISVLLARSVEWEDIRALAATAHPVVRDVSFVDEYVGPQVPSADQKSLTLRLRLGSEERTLVRAEIDEAVRGVVAALAERFDAQWRDA